MISTQIFKGAPLPLFTWAGVALVFGGSITYMIETKAKAATEKVKTK